MRYTHFNSDMVRLRDGFADKVVVSSTNFNSDMVRLRVSDGNEQMAIDLIFQFRHGAIKSRCEIRKITG